MRALWVMPTIPSETINGAQLYSVRMAEALASAGVAVTAIGLRDPGERTIALAPSVDWRPIDAARKSPKATHFSALPFGAATVSPEPVIDAFERIRAEIQPDWIVVDNYSAGWALRGGPEKIAYVSHNFETDLAFDIYRNFTGRMSRRVSLWLNYWKTARIERKLVESASAFTAISAVDTEAYAKAFGKTALTVTPGFDGFKRAGRVIDANTPRRVLMLGSMHWLPKRMNIEEFALIADPIFAAADIEMLIAGSAPADFVAGLAPRLKATRFIGYAENVAELYDGARMGLVVERTGGGFKLKVLDYIFARVPVFALANAVSGHEPELLAAFTLRGEMDELARTIVERIDSFDELNASQDAAYAFGSGHYDWKTRGEQLRAHLEAAR